MDISIFGLGYVGCVSLGCLAKHGHTVIGVDVSEKKVEQVNSGLATIIEKDVDILIREGHSSGRISATVDFYVAIERTEVSIVTVGTPTSANGHLDLSYIFNVAEHFGRGLKGKTTFHIIVIRSTVVPGTTDRFAKIVEDISGKVNNTDFAVVSNPEFLREGTAVQDYFNPPLTLIGSNNKLATEKVASLYENSSAEIIVCEVGVSEIMKYVNNSYHALKIAFANEVGNICSALKIDSHEVMKIFCMDRQLNISPYYLKPGFAYGGSCLPKDLKGLQTMAHDLYINVPLLDSIDQSNNFQISRALEIIQGIGKKKILFLGLSFKAGTDDLRDSPAVAVAETLLGKGYQVQIYDKNVHLSNLIGTNKEYIMQHIPHLAILMGDNIYELVKDAEIIVVNNLESEYVNVLQQGCFTASIVDMVHLPKEIRMRSKYYGINW